MKEYDKPQRSQSKFNSLCSPKEFPLKDITEKIIACAIEVHSTLGPGLLESVYEEALAYEFELRGIFNHRGHREFLFKKNKGSVLSVLRLQIQLSPNRLKNHTRDLSAQRIK